ncbi:MAG TPA: NAD-dependent epimerase/dehydratase family protein [Candidatus Dormibacteraeota bacterium]|nr:NAD-dependent epimerase/dehydratase family protein [Candidatus Dormibacteraeota bacterium]
MTRVLITGGTGFVGANLTRRLVRDGHEVHLLARATHDPWRIEAIRESIALHVADLQDLDGVIQTVERIRPAWVFHLAAHGGYSWQTNLGGIVATNVVGTANLLEACMRTGFDAFVNAGSSSEYGPKDHPAAEEEALEPNSYYAVAKASATLLCRHAARSRRFRIPTLRLYSVYGPYEEPNRLVPALIVHGLRGTLPPLTSPDTARDFVYVDDVVDAFLLAATRPGSDPGAVYNVGSGTQTPLRTLVELARQVLGIAMAPAWESMPNRAWDTNVWVADTRKIDRELGWRPMRTIHEGLTSTIRWLRGDPQIRRLYEQRLQDAGTGAAG